MAAGERVDDRVAKADDLDIEGGAQVRHRSAAKDAAVRANEVALVADLASGRLTFRSRPHEAHIQFSTHCNQSCVMCWNGANPPVVDIDQLVLDRLGHDLAPTLSILIPHDGSEPTSRRWDTACAFARAHGLRMHLTTNLQSLSPRRLRDALDVIASLDLSVDSHRPEVLERLRPGARTRAIFRNLPEVVAIATEARIDCEVNVVLTTENASDLPATIRAFAGWGVRAVSVIRLVHINGESRAIDPLLHLGDDEVAEIRDRSIDVAAELGVRLRWLIDDSFEVTDGEDDIPEAELEADARNGRLRMAHPGFCRFAHSGLRVTAAGDVAPCGYATGADLRLGNLTVDDFPTIWNGPNARDLRRAMHTGDLPSLCGTCQHAAPPPEQDALSMLERLPVAASLPGRSTVQVVAPAHVTRSPDAPRIVVRGLPRSVRRPVIVIARGGERTDRRAFRLHVVSRRGGDAVLEIPPAVWSSLETNTGYWFLIGRIGRIRPVVALTRTARCVIRSQPIPRVAGSTLRYPDTPDPVAVEVDLGFPTRRRTEPLEVSGAR